MKLFKRRRLWIVLVLALLGLVWAYQYLQGKQVTVTEHPVAGNPHRMTRAISFLISSADNSFTYDSSLSRFHVVSRYPVNVKKGACTASDITDREFDCAPGADPLEITDVRHSRIGWFNRVTISYEYEKP